MGAGRPSLPMPRDGGPIPDFRSALRSAIGFLHSRPALTFAAMGACFLAFGVATVDLYMLIVANLGLFVNYGLMVVDDGALRQLAELVALVALSGIFYIGFALCDRTLVRRLTEAPLRELSR